MRVLIAGLGLSGRSLVDFFSRRDLEYWTYDDCVEADFSSKNLSSLPWTELSHLAVSPGFSSKHPLICLALQKNIPIINDIELALSFCPQDTVILAVTGTNGKSTVAHLINTLLCRIGVRTHLVGNIGTPFLSRFPKIQSGDHIVLELSSFQLEYCSSLKARGSVVLNVSPAHQNRYGSFFEYCRTKMKISQNQTKTDICLLPERDFLLKDWIHGSPRVSCFSEKRSGAHFTSDKTHLFFQGESVLKWEELSLKGLHNRNNILVALTLLHDLNKDVSPVFEALTSLRSLRHRTQVVRKVRGALFVNDSKSTNAQSVLHGLQTFQNISVLILGGVFVQKTVFFMIASYLPKRVRYVIIYGQSAQKEVLAYFEDRWCVKKVADVPSAVILSASLVRSGEVVLFSPGCASFDLYKNFEHRGDVFEREVMAL